MGRVRSDPSGADPNEAGRLRSDMNHSIHSERIGGRHQLDGGEPKDDDGKGNDEARTMTRDGQRGRSERMSSAKMKSGRRLSLSWLEEGGAASIEDEIEGRWEERGKKRWLSTRLDLEMGGSDAVVT